MLLYSEKAHNLDWINHKPLLVLTSSLGVHLNTHYTQVGRADTHSSSFIPTFALRLSHFLNGVDAHDGHSVPRHDTVTQIPKKQNVSLEHLRVEKLDLQKHPKMIIWRKYKV